ncbi:sigma 54-interacting transcriptional regulator [Cytobacillus kochii]|uniref:sigma-54-dependent Fis family transcriptional regulator n=1 Tax=Cytobacillus kochii TaxID=859143 RepID=UPI0025A0DEFF|nr:sigma-54-dependent Fis family transcriptional regulator [Cytobacillus kochii]MDM5209371.1 sigma 54-interacting transcriptional regulator [Cytobacillus kochii]
MFIEDRSKTREKLEREEFLKVRYWMSPDPPCISLGETLGQAGEKMNRYQVSSLPVIDDHKKLVGIVSMKKLFSYLLKGQDRDVTIHPVPTRNFAYVRLDDSILYAASFPYEELPVVDENDYVVGMIHTREMMDGYKKWIHRIEQQENATEVLKVILERAYEGIAVVDQYGVVQEFNEAYSQFIGVKREDAIGRHVTEVIENTNLHQTVKTATPERGVVQRINGQDMIVHRIPLWQDGKVIGAIGMLIFEGVTEVYKIYQSLQKNQQENSINRPPFVEQLKNDRHVTLDDIVGESREIKEIKRLTRRAARTMATTLITGESGTGKEMVAKSMHVLSPFAEGPFISVNCGAIPESLFESELFGYEEGAFTGAKKGGKLGKFELAQYGTLFLDEIGELPLVMQTKLLRVLQEKEAERIGGNKKYPIRARIIAATNRNLKKCIQEGSFREDLYYRLNIIEIPLPSLKERKTDIPLLLNEYTKKICKQYQIEEKIYTPEAIGMLVQRDWPGNIRELVNVIERLVTLVEQPVIDITHIHTYLEEQPKSITKEPSLIEEAKDMGRKRERDLIIDTLRQVGGNKKKAAERLGIHRTTLYQKLKKFQL